MGIRLNKPKPNIFFRKSKSGGRVINFQVPQKPIEEGGLDLDTVHRILQEYRLHHCELLFKDASTTADDLIDVIEGNRRWIRCVYAFNKIDCLSVAEVDAIARRGGDDGRLRGVCVPISCYAKLNLDGLLDAVWDQLDMVRVYTKRTGQKPDFSDPVVLTEDRGGVSVGDLCRHIHRTLVDDLQYAVVWGTSAKHSPMRVGVGHRLEDEDVVQIVKQKASLGLGPAQPLCQTSP